MGGNLALTVGLLATLVSSGCAVRAQPSRIELWHTRRGQQQKVLEEIVRRFNDAEPGLPIRPDSYGSYEDLNRKIIVTAQTGSWPALATVYENQVPDYWEAGIVRSLDDLVADPETGLSPAEQADFVEIFLWSNRFSRFGNQLLSFPFTKSVLVMYYNRTLLRQAGYERPPQTWRAFEAQCRAVRAIVKGPAYALELDPSTLHGMIFSHGGQIVDAEEKQTLYDQRPTIRTFALLRRLTESGLASQMSGDDVTNAFQSQRVAFAIASSSARGALEQRIGDRFEWGAALPPHAEGVAPVTVLYGPNVCVFRTDPERERRAWRFIRYFTSTEVTAEWAMKTGYLPVRKSALKTPALQQFYATNPRARAIYAALRYARSEPPLPRMQLVRDQIREAATAVITEQSTPEAAAAYLKRHADLSLAGRD
ncbi:MAG: ABC transporter substrate-binding protein [Armatimonadetes bacterium]|nr:ABC transporter substrate-binding protein [Armatimonadota bacterium]